MTYRISLRSSSLWEPRHPLLKVLISLYLLRQGEGSAVKQTPAFGIWIVLDQDELFFRRAEKSKIGFKKGFGSEPAQQVHWTFWAKSCGGLASVRGTKKKGWPR